MKKSVLRHERTRTITIGLAALCASAGAAAGAGSAHGQVKAGGAGAGGATAAPAPAISAVACRSGCVALDAVEPGATLRVKGTNLGAVEEVVFLGGPGEADDVAARATRVRGTSVDVVVPLGAADGPLAVQGGDAPASAPSRDQVRIGAAAEEEAVTGPSTARVVADTAASATLEARVTSRTVYYAGATPATLRVRVKAPAPTALSVALVRVSDGAIVRRWSTPPVAPGAEQAVLWNGRVGRQVPSRRERFQFQVWTAAAAPAAAGAPTASAAQAAPAPEVAETVELRPYAFPIDGPHRYGEGAARFGGGRGHEGQDVFAECGTPIVAARGGAVQFKGTHARAGNYLVIDGDGTGRDFAYMHLQAPALPDKGDRVETGEVIGYVGDTGAASGCHLHFEIWSAPGWYEGGRPIDPLPSLKSWDLPGSASRARGA
ncbi:MAG: peptidoglycan DD-metalloendopeptidase family protein [Solirubrobacteraceae bacterium]|nr:peptidoglycan DD-metalloendopeptidase family protein [Solirubrobacteraceae bacterium]